MRVEEIIQKWRGFRCRGWLSWKHISLSLIITSSTNQWDWKRIFKNGDASDKEDDHGSVHIIIEKREDSNGNNITAVKRSSESKPLPTTSRTEDASGAPISPQPSLKNKSTKGKRKQKTKEKGTYVVFGLPEKLELVSALFRAQKGMKLEHLWVGDVLGARIALDKIITNSWMESYIGETLRRLLSTCNEN